MSFRIKGFYPYAGATNAASYKSPQFRTFLDPSLGSNLGLEIRDVEKIREWGTMWGPRTINALIAAVSGLLWFGAFRAHEALLPMTAHTAGIDVVFIPSGIRFFLLLIGGIWAALGVSLGSLFLAGSVFEHADIDEIAVISVCSGFLPLVALMLSMRLLGISESLSNLFSRHLPILGFGTALGSSILHNLLFWAFGIEPANALFSGIFTMAMGDFVGILLVVLFAIGALRIYRLMR